MRIKISRCKWALTACLLLVFITCSLVFSIEIKASEAERMEGYDREVLILQSYNRDFVHASDQELGILEVFENSPERIRFHYEFLDTKNYISDEYLALKYEEFAMKYAGRLFDAIILDDNDALNFYQRYGKKLWPDTRNVVATGINSVSHYPHGVDGVIIIEERFEYKKNIDLALMQCKDQEIKRLNFIYDDSTTSREIIKDIEALTKEQYPDYVINHYFDKTPEELRTIVDASDSHDLFFLTIYFQAVDGSIVTYNEVPEYIFKNAMNPPYGFIDFYLNSEIFGGYMISSKTLGEKAAEAVLKLWNNEYVPKIVYEDGVKTRLILDHLLVEKYDIRNIPREAILINYPESYFKKNRELILFFLAIIAILVVILILLSYMLLFKNNLNNKNREINRLNLNLIEIQKDIIQRLGEVIETRSHETANHVSRVTQISRFLAEKLGLTQEDIRTLMTISPMHDIGKIGVPEHILNKPGKLTAEEFEIIKTHTKIGYDLLINTDNEILWKAAIVSLQHHEHFDGSGYPEGLRGDEIHIFARITAVADVYDALRSNRVYKKAWPKADAEAYILDHKGVFFDPQIVSIFEDSLDTISKIFEELADDEILI